MNNPAPETEEAIRARVDAESLPTLLSRHRFLPSEDPRVQGYEGAYRINRIRDLREPDHEGYVAASKAVGWGGSR
jgi:hypothetical protein